MKHILIVEDDTLLNKTLSYNLKSDGFDITSVRNARTAAEKLTITVFFYALCRILDQMISGDRAPERINDKKWTVMTV